MSANLTHFKVRLITRKGLIMGQLGNPQGLLTAVLEREKDSAKKEKKEAVRNWL